MTGRFAGKTAVVTGASRGIGLGIAERLVADGAQVVITARDKATLEQAVQSLGGAKHALGVPGKADDAEHQDDTIQRAIETFGSLDFLVNNTGINPTYGPMIELDFAVARKTFEVNSLAAIGWVRRVHSAWMKDRGGAIVNISSVSSVRPARNIGFYAATKAMLNSVTEHLAVELAPDIRVNGVAPAVVKTRFAAALYEGREDELKQVYPLERLGVPSDVAGVVAFLLSDDAAWMTGQTLTVDGGATLVSGEK